MNRRPLTNVNWLVTDLAPPDVIDPLVLPATLASQLAPTTSQTVPANQGVIVPASYAIADGTSLTVANGGVFMVA